MSNGRWLSVSLALELSIAAVCVIMLIPFSAIGVDILIAVNLSRPFLFL